MPDSMRVTGTNLVLQADHPIRSPGRIRTPFIASIDGGAVVVDLTLGDYIVIDTQVGGSVSVQNPTGGGGLGQDIIFLIQNWSSSNPFSLTWGSAYRLDPAFGGPGPGKLKTISFIRIGNVWVQQSASPDL